MYLKLMNKDMTCKNGFQYEIGKTYELEGELAFGRNGFHFCDNFSDCLFYKSNIYGDKRLFEVEPLGEIQKACSCIKNVYATDKIKIVGEINIEDYLAEIINETGYLPEYIIEW